MLFAAPPSYIPPKVVSQAPGVVEPAGPGKVLVQVRVNADGSFKVLGVELSNNNGDNAAALDIAKRSKYTPGIRNGVPVASILDFKIVFGDQSVSGSASAIDQLLHANDFAGAQKAANGVLAQSPGNRLVQAQLGVADSYLHDIPGAVKAFDAAGTIPTAYANVAMQAYALDAVAIASTAPRTSFVQAEKAVSLGGDYRAYFALGVAEQVNKEYADAEGSLQQAETMARAAAPPADPQVFSNIEHALLAAAQSAGDKPTADRVSADLAKGDPGAAGKDAALAFDGRAGKAAQGHDYAGAVALYEKAAAAAPEWAGGPEYTKAALVLATEPLPNYQAARVEAEKAVAADPQYAPAYYVYAVVMGQDALGSGNMDELQRATEAAYKAAQLADQSDPKLAQSARYFAKFHQVDMNLQIWSTGLSVNPRMALPFPVPNT